MHGDVSWPKGIIVISVYARNSLERLRFRAQTASAVVSALAFWVDRSPRRGRTPRGGGSTTARQGTSAVHCKRGFRTCLTPIDHKLWPQSAWNGQNHALSEVIVSAAPTVIGRAGRHSRIRPDPNDEHQPLSDFANSDFYVTARRITDCLAPELSVIVLS